MIQFVNGFLRDDPKGQVMVRGRGITQNALDIFYDEPGPSTMRIARQGPERLTEYLPGLMRLAGRYQVACNDFFIPSRIPAPRHPEALDGIAADPRVLGLIERDFATDRKSVV